MSDTVELTRDDEILQHIAYEHLLAAYKEILIALAEGTQGKADDTRFDVLIEDLVGLLDHFGDVVNKTVDGIPGALSLEEAEAKLEEMFKHSALLDGLPEDSYLPEDTRMH